MVVCPTVAASESDSSSRTLSPSSPSSVECARRNMDNQLDSFDDWSRIAERKRQHHAKTLPAKLDKQERDKEALRTKFLQAQAKKAEQQAKSKVLSQQQLAEQLAQPGAGGGVQKATALRMSSHEPRISLAQRQHANNCFRAQQHQHYQLYQQAVQFGYRQPYDPSMPPAAMPAGYNHYVAAPTGHYAPPMPLHAPPPVRSPNNEDLANFGQLDASEIERLLDEPTSSLAQPPTAKRLKQELLTPPPVHPVYTTAPPPQPSHYHQPVMYPHGSADGQWASSGGSFYVTVASDMGGTQTMAVPVTSTAAINWAYEPHYARHPA